MIISSWPGWRWKSWPEPGSSVTSMTTICRAPVFPGMQRQPIVPQSNSSWRTSDCFTKVLIVLLSEGDRLEAAHVLGHRSLGRQPIHRGGSDEADHALGVREHVRGVVRLGDRTAVAEHEDVRLDAPGCVVHRLDEGHALLECLRGRGAGLPARREAHR